MYAIDVVANGPERPFQKGGFTIDASPFAVQRVAAWCSSAAAVQVEVVFFASGSRVSVGEAPHAQHLSAHRPERHHDQRRTAVLRFVDTARLPTPGNVKFAGVRFTLNAPASDVGLDDVSMVCEPVEERRHNLDVSTFVEGEARDDASRFVPRRLLRWRQQVAIAPAFVEICLAGLTG